MSMTKKKLELKPMSAPATTNTCRGINLVLKKLQVKQLEAGQDARTQAQILASALAQYDDDPDLIAILEETGLLME
jgi:hypothetical protein